MKILRRTLIILSVLILALVAGMVIWAKTSTMAAEAAPLDAVKNDPRITWEEDGDAITLTPVGAPSSKGLVFYPGAKVHADAYAAKLAPLVNEENMTVVITKPTLGLALFDLRGLGTFTRHAPDVGEWLVGGHSLGGVRACMLAQDADGLVLFASYCSNDLHEADLPVISISGSNDGLSTPEKVADHRDKLPEHARMVEIPGANHAAFGDYGKQKGDGTTTITDDEMRRAIVDAIVG